ncbi:hypothetical protein F383_23366 [Gossypium arboreum]|uniref:Uncharacterized protein n=1 Tax=Gossypium arboreum TaxID=29729 RepID=A0A0B0NW80_GOSAR|nr:hypothetical protein F383_23366 [Gossypium arboreum]
MANLISMYRQWSGF